MNHLTSFALSSLFVSLVGCGDNLVQPDDAADDDQTAPRFPASCMDAGNGETIADGEYTLYVEGNEYRPWKAYCHKMNEFLSVGDLGTTYGEYAAGGAAVGTSVRTTYTRVRIDPATLVIDISDQTFATSVGHLTRGTEIVTSMPLGVAMACASGLTYGTAGIDLTSSPFVIDTAYALGGTSVNGGHALFRDGQWLEASVEGACGYIAPATVQGTPINVLADGWLLQVRYATLLQP